jgi:hypothetical protein
MAQREADVGTQNPKFIVDVGISLKQRGRTILGWWVTRKDGTQDFLEHKPVMRKKRTKARRAKAKMVKASVHPAPDESMPPMFRTL